MLKLAVSRCKNLHTSTAIYPHRLNPAFFKPTVSDLELSMMVESDSDLEMKKGAAHQARCTSCGNASHLPTAKNTPLFCE